MIYYGYDAFRADAQKLIESVQSYDPQVIIAIARGGLLLGQVMGHGLGLRNVQSIRIEAYDGSVRRDHVEILGACSVKSGERVLIVDDIVDSGKTLDALMRQLRQAYPDNTFKSASLFYKPTACIQPDFTEREATEWIDFFWEADYGSD